jgi:hypothetical protein
MDPMTIAEHVAKEIKEALKDNGISIMVFGQPVIGTYVEGKSKIPIFVVVDKFDSDTVIKIFEIGKKWRKKNVEGPFVLEMGDIEGMSDSIPEELLDIIMNYQVLEGLDVIKAMPKLNQEHLRAQAELSIRRYIYNLRWHLTQIIEDKEGTEEYLGNLVFYSQISIRVYHRLTCPWIRTTDEHLDRFFKEFPKAQDCLEELLDHVYKSEPLRATPVDIATKTIDVVLQPILQKIDKMGC